MGTVFEIGGEKAKVIMQKHSQGKTPTQIMKETGYSMAWIRQVIQRNLALRKLRGEEENEREGGKQGENGN